jgi:hypothetical protein
MSVGTINDSRLSSYLAWTKPLQRTFLEDREWPRPFSMLHERLVYVAKQYGADAAR